MKTLLLYHKEDIVSLGQLWRRHTAEWSTAHNLTWPVELPSQTKMGKKVASIPNDDPGEGEQASDIEGDGNEGEEIQEEDLSAELIIGELDLMEEAEFADETNEVEDLLAQLEETTTEPFTAIWGTFSKLMF